MIKQGFDHEPSSMRGHSRGRRRRRLAILLGLALLAPAGCAGYDDFSWKQMNFEVFRDPKDPVAVISDNKAELWARRRALLCMKEPLANGGTQQDQDTVVKVLGETAVNDPHAPCRMAAIETLRKFKDPRVVEYLKDAYYRAGSLAPESATVIRMLALSALGDTGNPAAIDLLVRVVKEPPTEGPDVDRQQQLNERTTAARALGKFKQYQAAAALVEVLRKEDDIALRTRAQMSLVSVTGKDLPADAKAWSDFLNTPSAREQIAHEPTIGERVLTLTGLKSE
jgi:HEAT repeat protein